MHPKATCTPEGCKALHHKYLSSNYVLVPVTFAERALFAWRFRDIVADGLFTFAIVVAEEEKAQAIRAALAEKPLRARVIVETSAELQKCPIQIGASE